MYNPSKREYHEFESMDAFLNANDEHVANTSGERFKWMGGRTLNDAKAFVRNGEKADSPAMKEARALMDKIDAAAHDRERDEWVPSVQGAYPMVGDYLMGMPESMRERRQIVNDNAPVRVVLESVVSGGVGDKELMRRGAAVAALVQRMSEERAVELWVGDAVLMYDSNTEVVYRTRLSSNPINLAQVIAVFTSASYNRQIVFNYCGKVGQTRRSSIGWGCGAQPGPQREHAMRKVMGLSPQDILIQGGYVTDSTLMRDDPVAWVNKQLEKQRTLSND